MKSLTSSKDCIVSASDDTYLTWNEMNVTIFGPEFTKNQIAANEVCKDLDPLHRIIFPLGNTPALQFCLYLIFFSI